MKTWLLFLFYSSSLLAMDQSVDDINALITKIKLASSIKPILDPKYHFDYLPFQRPEKITDTFLDTHDLPPEITDLIAKFCNNQLQQNCSLEPMQKQFSLLAKKLLDQTTIANWQQQHQTMKTLEHPALVKQTQYNLYQQYPHYSPVTLSGHTKSIFCLALAKNYPILASGSADQTVKLWKKDGQNNSANQTLEGHSEKISSLCFMPQETHLASGSDETVHLWDIRTGKTIADLSPKQNPELICCFEDLSTYDENTLIAGSSNSNVYLWDVRAPNNFEIIENKVDKVVKRGWEKGVKKIVVSPNKNFFVTGLDNGAIVFWDIRTKKPLKVYEQATPHRWPVNSIKFLSFDQDAFLISGSWDGNIKKWNSDKNEQTISTNANILSGTIGHPNQIIVSDGNDNITVWSGKTGKKLHTISHHTDKIIWSVISDANGTLYSASDTITVWRPSTSQELLKAYAEQKAKRTQEKEDSDDIIIYP